MMRDAEKTVGNMIDKLKTAFIGSIDSEGFPNMKAMLHPCVWRNTGKTIMRVFTFVIQDFLEVRCCGVQWKY